MGNDLISGVDPDGAKKVHYNADGSYSHTTHDNWFHNTMFGTRNFIEDGSGNSFRLSDQAFSVMTSEGFEGRVEAAVSPFDPMAEDVVSYVLRESGDFGFMDQKQQLNSNMIFDMAGRAINVNEAGNVVWGTAMRVFGMDPFGTFMSAHGGTMMLRGRLDEMDEARAATFGSYYMQNSLRGRSIYNRLYKQVYGSWIQKHYELTPR